MKIHNVRLGFATNSSSSHSIIFDPSITPHDDYDEDFGWSFFTASSRKAKSEYLAATLRQNLSRELPDLLVMAILRGLGFPEQEKNEWGECGPSVDHQSLFNLPYEFGTNHVSLEFFEEFKNYLMRDGIHILGGNDNTEDVHPLHDSGNPVYFGNWGPDRSACVCRKDGDWWTLYSKDTGNRVVLTFNDNAKEYKPLTPMLMDVKITDYCSHGCSYCYQGSTTEGKHMKESEEYSYASLIREAEVFEIAIGGGEPTQCPSFERFIRFVNNTGVIVNFTTKSTDWLEDEDRANKILPHIGAFAYSAGENSESSLDRIYTIFKYRKYDLKKFTVQVVPATLSKFQLENILKKCHQIGVRVTLLGFKETGRGLKFKEIAINRQWNKFDETEWLRVIEELNQEKCLPRLSIDTTLASRYTAELKKSGIPDWLYHIEEGKYSMYMDFVNKLYGPSSYHLNKLAFYTGPYDSDIKELFSQIEEV